MVAVVGPCGLLVTFGSASICFQRLLEYIDIHKERLSKISNERITYSIDGHGENALYHANKLQFLTFFGLLHVGGGHQTSMISFGLGQIYWH